VRILDLAAIRRVLDYGEVIGLMRDALMAQSRGECDTPMPMHLDVAPVRGEVHIKSSYRRGGKYFALKIASTFPLNAACGMSTGNGIVLLSSAETGETVAVLADQGHLTDLRTAAVAAMVTRELRRSDTVLGILGSGIQARLQVAMHAAVLELRGVRIWGRTPQHAADCADEIRRLLPRADVAVCGSPAEVAREARLIVTATAARSPLLRAADVQPGSLILAVGSDSPGKQELDAQILRDAALLLADSRAQCEKLGELQHAPGEWARAVEIGAFCEAGGAPPAGTVVADFTGLGVEDLYIAEHVFERSGH
jgi:ornithine cyclodeaminase/alanine dehydrogenase-like protein (mu-crystallin family)